MFYPKYPWSSEFWQKGKSVHVWRINKIRTSWRCSDSRRTPCQRYTSPLRNPAVQVIDKRDWQREERKVDWSDTEPKSSVLLLQKLNWSHLQPPHSTFSRATAYPPTKNTTRLRTFLPERLSSYPMMRTINPHASTNSPVLVEFIEREWCHSTISMNLWTYELGFPTNETYFSCLKRTKCHWVVPDGDPEGDPRKGDPFFSMVTHVNLRCK